MKSIRVWTAASLALACAMTMLAAQSSQAQTYKVLQRFNGTDGWIPYANLIQDAKGNLYGTTQATVFKLDKAGKQTVLHSFTGGADGGNPLAGVILDAKGNLYGTTYSGGAHQAGVVFKLSKTGHETVLYAFTGGTDGGLPVAGVTRDADGNIFGTTSYGGDISCNEYGTGCGTVFKLSKAGKETVLHSFAGSDGAYPVAGVIQDPHGNLYGTTAGGGAVCDCGVVFKLSKTGKETVLHTFGSGTDGAEPFGLIQDAQWNLYGTTAIGGAADQGTVFKLSRKGKETVLYSFRAGTADGGVPVAGIFRDIQGNLYGATAQGGGAGCQGGLGCGTVFEVSKAGKETVLYSFKGFEDGFYPAAGVIRDDRGNLYGTTSQGGNPSCEPPYGCGLVFKLTP